jgi:hypothetical protein
MPISSLYLHQWWPNYNFDYGGHKRLPCIVCSPTTIQAQEKVGSRIAMFDRYVKILAKLAQYMSGHLYHFFKP